MIRSASPGQALGRHQFLAYIRKTDAICQVVRMLADPGAPLRGRRRLT